MFFSFPGVFVSCLLFFTFVVSIDQSAPKEGSLVNAAIPNVSQPWHCLPGPGAKTQLKPRCISCGTEPHCPGGLLLRAGLLDHARREKGQKKVQTAWPAIFKVRESYPYQQQYEKAGKVALEARFLFANFALARHLGLSALVTCTCPNVLALLMSV